MRRFIVLLFLAAFATQAAQAQIYAKMNALYLPLGVINPQVEMALTPHSSFQTEMVFSPWRSISYKGQSHPMLVGVFLNEYKYYFKQVNSGWYACANGGLMAFRMSKPTFEGGKLGFKEQYGKGWGLQLAVGGGWQHQFAERWLVDCFFTFGWYHSMYSEYSKDGEINMDPGHLYEPKHPDPWNGSSEWLPNKIGVSIGYRIFK